MDAIIGNFVHDENGQKIYNSTKERALFQSEEGVLLYVPVPEDLESVSGKSESQAEKSDAEVQLDDEDSTNNAASDDPANAGKWSKPKILELIALYKEHKGRFESTTCKNAVVWKEIQTHLANKTIKQITNKWKYIKSKYHKKKDNMGKKETGTAPLNFQYLDEMDDIFWEKPNVKPVALCNSSNAIDNFPPANASETLLQDTSWDDLDSDCVPATLARAVPVAEGGTIQNKKGGSTDKRKNRDDELLMELREARKEREKRHPEKQSTQERAVSALEKMASALERFVDRN